MNKGVELLLARMDSNPEEFQGFIPSAMGNTARNTRWLPFLTHVHKNDGELFTDEEREAVLNKLKRIQGESFTHAVMQELTK